MTLQEYLQLIRSQLTETHGKLLTWFDESEAIKHHRPIDQGWTVLEILEHISLTSHFLLLLIDKGADKALCKASQHSEKELPPIPDDSLERLHPIGWHKSFPWIWPEHMEPSGQLKETAIKDTLTAQFNRCIHQLDQLKNGEGLLHKTKMSVHGLGKINVYEYIYFLSKHAERHIG
ncbi:MAG: DinB family protein [Bacteroidota bacterium]